MSKKLVAYFFCQRHYRKVAEDLADAIGGIFEIRPEVPYQSRSELDG